MGMKAPLKKVRGLGSAKEGTSHWWYQRVTALAMIPLFIIALAYVISLVGADYTYVRHVLGTPVAAMVMLLLIAVMFYHMKLGLQIVIEDYIHTESRKMVLLLLNSFLCAVIGLAAALAVLKLALGS